MRGVGDMTKYCEFTGDQYQEWDEVPKSKRLCKHAGYVICTLHDSEIKEDLNGWRRCCPECTTPFYEPQT